jgi:hypothetical protein
LTRIVIGMRYTLQEEFASNKPSHFFYLNTIVNERIQPTQWIQDRHF